MTAKNIFFTLIIGFTLVTTGILLFGGDPVREEQHAVLERMRDDADSEMFDDTEEDGYIYETDASGPEECSSLEEYDEEAGVCYFECDNEEECAAIEADIDEELGALEDEYTESAGSFKESEPGEGPSVVTSYQVNADETITLKSGIQSPRHAEIWRLFARISPDSFTKAYVETFEIADDSSDDTLAYVHDEDGNALWSVGVNLGAFGQEGKREDVLTLVHEFAHIVTLNQTQIVHAECGITYDTGDGCAKAGSYLNTFVQKFWPGQDRALALNGTNLFERSPQRFPTEYAASSPEEDIAESFALFVLGDGSTVPQTIAEQKVAFFKDYPELVQLRASIRKGLGSIMLERKRR
ncbi:MAG: hypothetical protein RI911_439 [Candidatus Parcubacteria bacterium]